MKILKLPAVIERCSLSKSSIYFYIAQNKFPRPIKLGERGVGFIESEIDSYLAERAAQRGGK